MGEITIMIDPLVYAAEHHNKSGETELMTKGRTIIELNYKKADGLMLQGEIPWQSR
ncbi:MAG: hypothetical protein WAO19_12785 [Candidatus Kryptoniota bacterium]